MVSAISSLMIDTFSFVRALICAFGTSATVPSGPRSETACASSRITSPLTVVPSVFAITVVSCAGATARFGIMTASSSENFDDVRAVLEGRGGDRVRSLRLRPGDLQLFKGRYALHRVGTVTGARERHTAIFSYSERPGVVGSPARTRQLFGRLLPEHAAAGRAAVRVDELLD